MNQPSSRNTLNDTVLASIGAVAVESSYLENTLVTMIWHLLRVSDQEQGHILTDSLNLKSASDLFQELSIHHLKAKYRDDKENLDKGIAHVKGHDSICSRIAVAVPKRNKAIHGFWFDWTSGKVSTKSSPHVLHLARKPRDGSLPKAEDASWLDALAVELCQIRNELGTFAMLWLTPSDADLDRHSFQPPASLGKS